MMRTSIPALLLLAFASAGFQAAPAKPPAPAAPKAPVKPTPPPVLEGVVKGPDGKALAEALVAARPMGSGMPFDDAPTVVARTDEAGRFKLILKSPRPHNLRVEARGLAARTLEKVSPGEPLSVTLQKGGVIEGTVRDAGTGEPVARARVEAREEGGFGSFAAALTAGTGWETGAGVVEAVTDDKGRFRLEGVAAGVQSVTAAAKGFGRARRGGVVAGGRADLMLLPGASVHGTVLGADGRPVAGALVRAEADSPFRGGGGAGIETTDAKGRFEIVGLEPGSFRLVARHKDFAPAVAAGVSLERGGEVQADLVMERGARIVGRLVGASQQPIAGRVVIQEISGQRTPRSLDELFRAEAGKDGAFRIVGVPTGSHALAASAPGHAAQRVEVEVRPRDAQADVGDIALETGLVIRGRVIDKAGSPIADAQIRGLQPRPGFAAAPAEGRSETDGSFAIGGLSAGGYRLSVSAPGYGNVDRPVEAPSENVEVVLQPAGRITGQVVDEGGRAIEAFRVSAQPGAPTRGTFGMRMVTAPRTQTFAGSEGRFTIEDVAEGTYVVQASAPDRADGSVSDVKVAAGGTTDVGRVRLGAGGIVRGTVVDLTGTPVPAATVSLRGAGSFMMSFQSTPQAATDSSGAFELKGVSAGTMEVVATHPQFAEGRVPVEVDPAKGPAEAKLVLSQGGRIEGSVRKRDGTGIPGTYVQVSSMQGGGPSFSGPGMLPTSADGSFVVEHVAAGRAMVVLMNRTGDRFASAQTKELDVREGETSLVEFKSREILLSGRVTRSSEAAANVRLNLGGQSGMMMMMSFGPGGVDAPAAGPQRMTALTREDGSYEMLVDEPGRFQVSAQSADRKASYPTRTIDVADADGQVADLNYSGLSVAGQVVDRDTEQPLANVGLFAMPKEGNMRGGVHAETAADGRFVLELDPGEYRLTASSEGYANEELKLDVGASGASDVRLALSRGHNLRGKVVDAGGRGVGGVFVVAVVESSERGGMGNQGSPTQPDGTFEISGLAEATHNLIVRSDLAGFAFRAGVQPGQKDIVLTLRPGGRVVLSVFGPDGAPVEGAFAGLTKVAGARAAGFGARTNAQGVAEVTIPAGAVELEVNKDRLKATLSVSVAEGGAVPAEVRLAETPPGNAPKAVGSR